MNISSYMLLHYGKDWMKEAIASVLPFVDDVWIFYSEQPSFGRLSHIPCPDKKEDLKAIADSFGDRIKWIDVGRFPHEGGERDYAISMLKRNGVDIIVVLDSDEVWDQDYLPYALDFVIKDGTHFNWRCSFRHFWKSVNWICDDPAWPNRILDARLLPGTGGDGYVHKRNETDTVYHFGYAQRPEIIEYKIKIWGHAHELRPNWFAAKFKNWTPDILDVHPVCDQHFWDPKPFDKTKIKHLIGDSPLYDN